MLHQTCYVSPKIKNMKTSLVYYPNTQKKNKKTGKTPIYLRVISNRKKAETRLNLEVSEEDLLKWDPMTMRFSSRDFYANHVLNNLDQKFFDLRDSKQTSLSQFDPSQIRDHLLGKCEKNNITVMDFVDRYFEKAVRCSAELSLGTMRNYEKAIKHLRSFLNFRGSQKLQLKEFNNNVALEFKDYLLAAMPECNRKGMSQVSAYCYVKKLKTVFGRAVDEKIIDSNPLKIIKLKNRSPMRQRLTIHQVKRLCDLDTTHFPAQSLYKDIFLFSVFTGLSNGDAMTLTIDNLDKRKDGNVKLTIPRAKTDVLTESFLVMQARQILEKYQDRAENQITGRVLPKRSNKELNVQLKILADMANIPMRLTSHMARHTFRQLLAEAGTEDVGVIKRMMGQSRRGDIDEVYYNVTESRLMEAKNKFEIYLKTNLSNG